MELVLKRKIPSNYAKIFSFYMIYFLQDKLSVKAISKAVMKKSYCYKVN